MPRMKWYGWAWGVVELFVFAWLVTLDPHARGWFGMTNRIWLVLVAIGLLIFLVSVLFARLIQDGCSNDE